MIVVTPVFGTVELRSWIELAPNGDLIGMGQAIHKDDAGNIVKVVTEPTGATMKVGA